MLQAIGLWSSIGWLIVIVVATLLAPLLPLDPAKTDYAALLLPPLEDGYLLGSDGLGRDILARIVYGARPSLLVGIGAGVLGAVVGGALGILSGYAGGGLDHVLRWFSDFILAFPGLVLLLVLAAVLDVTLVGLIVALALITFPIFMRLARAATLSLRTRDFVTAAMVTGASRTRIMVRQIAPLASLSLLAYLFVMISVLIVAEGSLSFLGLGIEAPTPSWGGMVAAGRGDMEEATHVVLVPSAVLFFTVISLNVIGERLRRRWSVGAET